MKMKETDKLKKKQICSLDTLINNNAYQLAINTWIIIADHGVYFYMYPNIFENSILM